MAVIIDVVMAMGNGYSIRWHQASLMNRLNAVFSRQADESNRKDIARFTCLKALHTNTRNAAAMLKS